MSNFNPLEPLSHIEIPKSRLGRRSDSLWIGMFLIPMVMLLAALAFGYATTWLSTNFVQQDQFSRYVEKQVEADRKQDQDARERFEITQTKLQTIINQQITYGEQIKLFNEIVVNIKDDLKSLEERIKYIERNQKSFHLEKF